MHTLVLLRHGESAWNKENRFTGWTDVGLSEKGFDEAQTAWTTTKAQEVAAHKIKADKLAEAERAVDQARRDYKEQVRKDFIREGWSPPESR